MSRSDNTFPTGYILLVLFHSHLKRNIWITDRDPASPTTIMHFPQVVHNRCVGKDGGKDFFQDTENMLAYYVLEQ